MSHTTCPESGVCGASVKVARTSWVVLYRINKLQRVAGIACNTVSCLLRYLFVVLCSCLYFYISHIGYFVMDGMIRAMTQPVVTERRMHGVDITMYTIQAENKAHVLVPGSL